jgi:hypothetical protein
MINLARNPIRYKGKLATPSARHEKQRSAGGRTMFKQPLLFREFYIRATASAGADVKYIKREALNLEVITAYAGILAVIRCALNGPRFMFDDGGTRCAVVEVLGEDAATSGDLVAWPIDEPERFATALGEGAMLGEAQVYNPASWAFDQTLPVHRTPLRWLKADCVGIVILDHHGVLPILARRLGRICGEDKQHALDLMAMFSTPPVDLRDILYPMTARRPDE